MVSCVAQRAGHTMLWRCSDCAFVFVVAASRRSSSSQGCCYHHPALIAATHRPAPLLMSVECTLVSVASRQLVHSRPRAVSLRRAFVTLLRGKGPARFCYLHHCIGMNTPTDGPTRYHEHSHRQFLPLALSLLNKLPSHRLSYPNPCRDCSFAVLASLNKPACIATYEFSDWRSIRTINLRFL
jgi:hypothetical protein